MYIIDLACTKGDSLDDYMKVVSAQFDNATVSKMKFKIHQLQNVSLQSDVFLWQALW